MPADPVAALLACPHGVGTGKVQQGRGRTSDGNGWLSVVVCQDCGSRGPELLREDAIDAWNSRTPTPASGDVAIPAEIAAHVRKIGKVEWGQTPAHDADGHGRHVADSVRMTAANFGQSEDQHMHGLWLEGTETVLCHTGTSPNAPKTTQALVGAWNWLVDQSAFPTPDSSAVSGSAEGLREPHVFLDCDGVLADFDTYAEAYFGMNPREYEKRIGSAKFWQQLEAKGDFYRNLPLMPDAMALYEGVKHLHPTILTGCPRGDWAQGQKVAWAAEHFPGVPIITCRSADKREYAKQGDVLIDDWPQHRHRWIEMGGVFIVHHDAASSLAALWAHYPTLTEGQQS